MAVSCFVFGIQGASHLKEGGLFWLQQPNMGMKLKKIIKEIENKVYEIEIGKDDSKYFQENYRVSNLYHSDDKIIVRTVTDNPPEGYSMSPVNPTLEDLYLYVFESGE